MTTHDGRHVLVLNAGSSSLKYQVLVPETTEVLAKGLVERIGEDGSGVPDHGAAMAVVTDQLAQAGIDLDYVAIEAGPADFVALLGSFAERGGAGANITLPLKRRAFELTRQAIGYRMLQLLALPIESMDRVALQAALIEIGQS